jgi:uncharacterized membrane protein YfcA
LFERLLTARSRPGGLFRLVGEVTEQLLMGLVGLFAGALGSMVGLGGGVFIIPALTLFLDVPIHQAIAASLVSVIATSSVASVAYVRTGLSNIKLGMTMESMTVVGALLGGLVGGLLSREVLSGIFGVVMMIVAVHMGLRRADLEAVSPTTEGLGALGHSYRDPNLGREVNYRVRRLPLGLGASLVAGWVSGLLGVGGGFLQVPVMAAGMRVPLRAAVATSSLMLGVTACAGSIVYFSRGMIDPSVAAPVVFGVSAGALLGSRLSLRMRSAALSVGLAVILFILALQMLLSVAGIRIR